MAVIKYIGSKRTLVPVLGAMARALDARTAVDLFTGTTRVAQEFKRAGLYVTAADIATYSGILSDCHIATDAARIDGGELASAIERLNALPGVPGYVTETFCVCSRYFQPKNGARIDAIREAIEADYRDSALYPILLTSLMVAADRVDSTTGLQMSYLKDWAPRAFGDLTLCPPTLLDGPGRTIVGDAVDTVDRVGPADLMYLDPPYNQHRYFTNYHIWETLVRWDFPEHYGVACKRADAREACTKSVFNSKRRMPDALGAVLCAARAQVLIVSCNDESWISAEQMVRMLRETGREDVRLLAFDRRRYVGSQIGVYGPSGTRVGRVRRLRNVEYVFVAGERSRVEACVAAARPYTCTAT